MSKKFNATQPETPISKFTKLQYYPTTSQSQTSTPIQTSTTIEKKIEYNDIRIEHLPVTDLELMKREINNEILVRIMKV